MGLVSAFQFEQIPHLLRRVNGNQAVVKLRDMVAHKFIRIAEA
jgi:hypothetical protein